MDAELTKKVLQYALACAGLNEDWKHRKLRPIHLIKYAYIADLAYAEQHGATYTGIDWIFYNFGPWAWVLPESIRGAMDELGAEDHSFESDFKDEPQDQWKSRDPEGDRRAAGKGLNVIVKMAIEKAVKEWADDTPGLLHHVYGTKPMRTAAPNEPLVFQKREAPPQGEAPQELSKRKQRLRSEKLAAFRKQLAAERDARQRPKGPRVAPRYDDVYLEGAAWLDQEAGGKPEASGMLAIDASVWKSDFRGEEFE